MNAVEDSAGLPLVCDVNADCRMFLRISGINPHMRDSKGRTALEVLREQEQHRTSDLTYIIQSREGWSECRKIIDGQNFS